MRMITPHDVPHSVREVCAALREKGYRAWVVGGSVRDVLIGRAVGDWDICTSATPQEVQGVFRRVIPTGIAHGTVTVLLHGESFEVTTLRGEGAYTDGRRPDSVHFVREIDEDLARRDFTVNAIAYDPFGDQLADPFGGVRDIESKTLRAVGDAKERFSEDGLRVLRAARLSATLDFDIAQGTLDAIGPTLETFRRVSPERVRDEWMKAMKARKPSRAFRVMQSTGMLDITAPDLATQVGCTQNQWHAYDVWNHSLECMDAFDGAPVTRLAALLHDVGKPRTRAFSDKTNDYTFYNHESVGASMADEWLRAYRFSNDERQAVTHLIRNHLVCYSDEWTDAAVRRFMRRVGDEHLDSLLALARADALGKGRPVERELADLDTLRERIAAIRRAGDAVGIKDLALDGNVLMTELKLRPGKHIGVILQRLLERVTDEPALNQRESLLGIAQSIADEVVT